MKPRTLVERAVELICLSRQGVPCLIGNTGVGKTDLIKYLAKKHKKKLVIINTSVVNVDDLSGFPYREDTVMKWAIPDWFPREKDCLLFLDEFNRADKQVINALMPVLLSGELHHGAVLPEDCWVVVAFNPDTDDYDMVNSFDDLAISSRLFKIEVTNDPAAWHEWAQTNLNADNQVFKTKLIKNMMEYSKEHKVSIQINQIPNNRSFSKAIGIIDYAKKHNKDDYFNLDVVLTAVRGILGNKYVDDNWVMFKDCMTDRNKSFCEIIDDICKDETLTEPQKIKALSKELHNGATEEDYRNLVGYLSKISNRYKNIIISELDIEDKSVMNVFTDTVLESLWNS